MTDRSRRRPWLAVLLALAVSGLGHAYLRRWARAFGQETSYEAIMQASRNLPRDASLLILGLRVLNVIDAYVLALRNNREYERDRRRETEASSQRADSGTAPERADQRSPTARTDTGTPTGRSDQSTGDAERHAEAVSCPHCGRETDPAFDFCQWCAEPVDR